MGRDKKYEDQTQIGIRVERELLNKVKEICFKNQDTMTDVINRCLYGYVKNNVNKL